MICWLCPIFNEIYGFRDLQIIALCLCLHFTQHSNSFGHWVVWAVYTQKLWMYELHTHVWIMYKPCFVTWFPPSHTYYIVNILFQIQTKSGFGDEVQECRWWNSCECQQVLVRKKTCYFSSLFFRTMDDPLDDQVQRSNWVEIRSWCFWGLTAGQTLIHPVNAIVASEKERVSYCAVKLDGSYFWSPGYCMKVTLVLFTLAPHIWVWQKLLWLSFRAQRGNLRSSRTFQMRLEFIFFFFN